jgi:hypothetical protein
MPAPRWWLLSLAACGAEPVLDAADPVNPDEPEPIEIVAPSVGLPTVRDVAVEAGVQGGPGGALQRGRACIAADFDLDGRLDLYVGNPGDQSYVLRNETGDDGVLRFGPPSVLMEGGLPWGGAGADYDGDGDLDLYISVGGNEGEGYDRLLRNLLVETGAVAFEDVTDVAGIAGPVTAGGVVTETASAGGVWGDIDQDGDDDLFVSVNSNEAIEPGSAVGRNIAWRNNGDGTFTDVTEAWQLDGSHAKTRHSTLLDIDNDGDLDLFENNFRGLNVLWRNQLAETGETRFTDITAAVSNERANLSLPRRAFASAAADFNNDGHEDLVVFSRGFSGLECGDDGTETDLSGVEGHALFLNLGREHGFVEVSEMARINGFLLRRDGIPMAGNGVMGSQVGDVNGDGLVDLFIGNGGPFTGNVDDLLVARELRELDLGGGLTVMVPIFDEWTSLLDFPAPVDPRVQTPYPVYPYRAHGSCLADFDGDGLVEIFVANGGPASEPDDVREPDRMFKFSFADGEAPNTLHVQPRGDGGAVALDAIGTRLALTVREADGSERVLHRRLYGGSGFSAQNGLAVQFGLGTAVSAERLVVAWPDGRNEIVQGPFALGGTIEIER